MEVVKLHELWVFTSCLLAGVASGIVFDTFRAVRRCIKVSDTVVAIHDMLFWSITCVIVYMAIYFSNGAQLRWFELIALVSGSTLYMLCISRWCIKPLCYAVKFVCRVSGIAVKPFLLLVKGVKKLCIPVLDGIYSAKGSILYKIHRRFSKRSHKIAPEKNNICKKFFFTFFKR